MKRNYNYLLLSCLTFAALCMTVLPAKAQKFTFPTAAGQKLHFKVLSASERTAALIKGHYKDHSYEIPATVTYQDIPYTVTEVGDEAFCEQDDLHTIKLPPTIVRIGKRAFEDAEMTSFIFPRELKEIGDAAFRNCNLTAIVVPEGVTSIGNQAFDRNGELQILSLPHSIQYLGSEIVSENALLHITSLPSFITLQNCQQYGFSPIAVEAYYRMSPLKQ